MAAALGICRACRASSEWALGIMRDRLTEGWPPARGRGHNPLPRPDGVPFAGVRGEGSTNLNAALAKYVSARFSAAPA